MVGVSSHIILIMVENETTKKSTLVAHMICNPEKPDEEYILLSPEQYVQGFKYSDYLIKYNCKPIVVNKGS